MPLPRGCGGLDSSARGVNKGGRIGDMLLFRPFIPLAACVHAPTTEHALTLDFRALVAASPAAMGKQSKHMKHKCIYYNDLRKENEEAANAKCYNKEAFVCCREIELAATSQHGSNRAHAPTSRWLTHVGSHATPVPPCRRFPRPRRRSRATRRSTTRQ